MEEGAAGQHHLLLNGVALAAKMECSHIKLISAEGAKCAGVKCPFTNDRRACYDNVPGFPMDRRFCCPLREGGLPEDCL